MKPSVIVWDLETVPDLGEFAAANDLVGNLWRQSAFTRAQRSSPSRTSARLSARPIARNERTPEFACSKPGNPNNYSRVCRRF
jgi:hypothetical protein